MVLLFLLYPCCFCFETRFADSLLQHRIRFLRVQLKVGLGLFLISVLSSVFCSDQERLEALKEKQNEARRQMQENYDKLAQEHAAKMKEVC